MPVQLPLPHFAQETSNYDALEYLLTEQLPLWHFPAARYDDLVGNATLLGTAGEALVDSQMMRRGLVPLPVPPCFPADRIVLHPNGYLHVQIKTTCSAGNDGNYRWNASRGYRNSPHGRRTYGRTDYDLIALVALDADAVLYTTDTRPRYTASVEEVRAARARPRGTLEQCFTDLGIYYPIHPNVGADEGVLECR